MQKFTPVFQRKCPQEFELYGPTVVRVRPELDETDQTRSSTQQSWLSTQQSWLVSRLFEWYTLVQLDERSWSQGSGKTFKSRCGGMVDTRHLKCRGRKPVPVQVRPAVRVGRN